jgi:ribose-phosphate pyrophosphokinase
MSEPLIFAPDNSRAVAERIAAALGVELASSEEREFENGEHKMRPLTQVSGRDVYVFAQLCGDPAASANDKLCRLLFFIGALKDAGAASVTACLPYLPYARKDRRTKSSDAINLRYVAQLFEAMRTDRIVVLDVHNLAAFENAFRIPTIPLDAAPLFAAHFRELGLASDWVIASPDIGGVKRAHHLRDVFEAHMASPIASAFMDKQRSSGVVRGEGLVGEVTGKRVLLLDDMISTGTTMARAVAACREAGAIEVHIAATHAVLQSAAMRLFTASDAMQRPQSVVVSNSVALPNEFRALIPAPLAVIDIAATFAEVVRRLSVGDSVGELCGLA